ncbi:hypothetical protein Clacol_002593 [Clathrus columnatus]|uniref:Phospholipase/carboxylesterase/thioesterase domain-containing protein n=1 Tax=Clathrus columnatus TaxID=1419009 RepID=A0AAV5A6L3_9AGAM|nr:hypothetical protein Clacol_002593 [Clathrus columnatus]
MESPLIVRPVPEDMSPRTKPEPQVRSPLGSAYLPSDDATDENLIPYLGDEEAYQWYESFDNLGELLANPNPTRTLELLEKLLEHIVNDCKWSPNKIHLFGFGQGGSIALELGLKWWKTHGGANRPECRLGSIVTIAGPLLSYPTLTPHCPTPMLAFHRPESEQTRLTANELAAFRKGFGNSIQEVKASRFGEGMPHSREEWEPIMKFWSSFLSRRSGSGLYQVLSGDA